MSFQDLIPIHRPTLRSNTNTHTHTNTKHVFKHFISPEEFCLNIRLVEKNALSRVHSICKRLTWGIGHLASLILVYAWETDVINHSML